MSGCFKIHRSIFSNPVLSSPASVGAAWILLLAQAKWPEGVIVMTHEGLARTLGWNLISAKRLLIRFQKAGFITIERGNRDVTVTIVDRTTFSFEGMQGNGSGELPVSFSWQQGKSKAVLGYGREPIPNAIRKAVFERDGEVCAYCGDQTGPFELDHITPVALGGGNEPSNLTVACKPCNSSKSATPLNEWMMPHG